MHFCVARGSTLKLDENEAIEFAGFAEAVSAVEQSHDFVVIDTPGTDSYLMRLAHSMADTLITPLNDSFVDFDVLGTVDPTTFAVTGESHYAEMVREARRQRRLVDGTPHGLDRGAQPPLDARLAQQAPGRRGARASSARRLGFRCVDGLAERVIYREFFPRGLTALDDLDEATLGHAAEPVARHRARRRCMRLIEALKLPLDERGQRRAAARAEWFAAPDKPLEVHDLIGEAERGGIARAGAAPLRGPRPRPRYGPAEWPLHDLAAHETDCRHGRRPPTTERRRPRAERRRRRRRAPRSTRSWPR